MKCSSVAIVLAIAGAAATSGYAAAQAVMAVRPSATSVPASLLRLSIVFARPQTQPVIPRLELLRDDGTMVDAPFDPQELWSPDGLTLTVLLQPGRVKTGLVAHNTLGRALIAGEHVRLMFRNREIASWNVTSSNSTPPVPDRWKVAPPRAGTRATLSVRLDKPIDAMDRDLVAIATADGRRVTGKVTLSHGETQWSLVPRAPWRPGPYEVVVNAELEDSSGNRVGERFEHPATTNEDLPRDTVIPFHIR